MPQNHSDLDNPIVNYSTKQERPGRERPGRERPKRTAAARAANRISEWTKILRRPPEDVEET